MLMHTNAQLSLVSALQPHAHHHYYEQVQNKNIKMRSCSKKINSVMGMTKISHVHAFVCESTFDTHTHTHTRTHTFFSLGLSLLVSLYFILTGDNTPKLKLSDAHTRLVFFSKVYINYMSAFSLVIDPHMIFHK